MRYLFTLSFLLIYGHLLIAQSSTTFNRKSANNLPSRDVIKERSDQKHFSSNKIPVILPLSFVATGVLIETLPKHTLFSKERIQEGILNGMNGYTTKADNYLQFAPIAVMFGGKLAGMKSRSDLTNQLLLTAKSELLVTSVVTVLKKVISDWRPDGSANNSMPSGHTAQAFASAALLDMEYRETSPWISTAGYLMATATGFFRISNNRHWIPDVLVGAGIGIGCVKLVYQTHKYKWGNTKPIVIIPTIRQGGGGVLFTMKF